MRITYNSPVVLTYTLICVIITALDTFGSTGGQPGWLSQALFTVYPFGYDVMSLSNPITYFRLFSHAMGHAGWEHLVGNFTFILLIGPILEEKYGSRRLLIMIFLTALITGVLNASLFSQGLLGASGIVFMMILLVSFTNTKRGTLPLTFILIALLFLGKEIYHALQPDQISQFAHIIGGVFGGVFGYLVNNMPEKSAGSSTTTSSNLGL
jgi:membrane associated rhomboid family serine protease